MRITPPEPNRAYLQSIAAIEYDIEQIRKCLRLGTNDPDPTGFRAAVPYTKHLYQLMKVAAIYNERSTYTPCTKCGRDRHGFGGMNGKLCRYCDPNAYKE